MFPAPFDKPLPIAKRTREYLRDRPGMSGVGRTEDDQTKQNLARLLAVWIQQPGVGDRVQDLQPPAFDR